MHIPDGILPAAVLAGGYAASAALTYRAVKIIEQQEDPRAGMPRAALLTAAFFVASWIHIPIPPTSVHLVLNGLMGAILGAYAFPAILIGLFFQAVMFQHGGLTTLGVNALIMGAPALLAARIAGHGAYHTPSGLRIRGFLAGAGGILLSALLAALLLILTIPTEINATVERAAILSLAIAHVPLAAIEGVLTSTVLGFMQRVRPQTPAPIFTTSDTE